jgi:hypothetical protein
MQMRIDVEYGFVPKPVRDELDLESNVSLSKQVANLIGRGSLGAESMPVYLNALRAESLFFAQTARAPDFGNPDLARDLSKMADHYKYCITHPDKHWFVAQGIVKDYDKDIRWAKQRKQVFVARRFEVIQDRWKNVRDNLIRPGK